MKCDIQVLFYFQAYVEIFKGGELPEPKSMLDVSFSFLKLFEFLNIFFLFFYLIEFIFTLILGYC